MRRTNRGRKRAQATPQVGRADRLDAVLAPGVRPLEDLFAGPRPTSTQRGVEPAFLLFDRVLLDQLHTTADALGIRYDVLVQRIAREHVDKY